MAFALQFVNVGHPTQWQSYCYNSYTMPVIPEGLGRGVTKYGVNKCMAVTQEFPVTLSDSKIETNTSCAVIAHAMV